jgi:NAD(P)-dependent dehydrogenase (short-subunit alcohol dehydrogenase family)
VVDPSDPFAPFRLDGRSAIVTGASSGLGERFARILHASGADVVVAARRADRLAALVADLDGAVAVTCDVTQDADLERLVATTLSRFGRVDLLVNNAGVGEKVSAEAESAEHLRQVIDVNLVAAYRLTQLVGADMLERGRGVVVNIASVLGLVAANNMPQASYVASKHGMIGLTRDLAAQWARRGVRVNALCPGWFPSEMTMEGLFTDEGGQRWLRRSVPMGRGGAPHELDGALLFLASDASSYVTGAVLTVDGGYTAV